jgi:hypothetical protein
MMSMFATLDENGKLRPGFHIQFRFVSLRVHACTFASRSAADNLPWAGWFFGVSTTLARQEPQIEHDTIRVSPDCGKLTTTPRVFVLSQRKCQGSLVCTMDGNTVVMSREGMHEASVQGWHG